MEEELNPTSTPGYKVGAQKTVEELNQLDQNDQSMQKWKESLGLKQLSNDPVKVYGS
jgi:Rho GDP-dissociation inhibitor